MVKEEVIRLVIEAGGGKKTPLPATGGISPSILSTQKSTPDSVNYSFADLATNEERLK